MVRAYVKNGGSVVSVAIVLGAVGHPCPGFWVSFPNVLKAP